jgi:hypothetical protein
VPIQPNSEAADVSAVRSPQPTASFDSGIRWFGPRRKRSSPGVAHSAEGLPRYNRSFDTDVLSAGFASLLAAGQLRR